MDLTIVGRASRWERCRRGAKGRRPKLPPGKATRIPRLFLRCARKAEGEGLERGLAGEGGERREGA